MLIFVNKYVYFWFIFIIDQVKWYFHLYELKILTFISCLVVTVTLPHNLKLCQIVEVLFFPQIALYEKWMFFCKKAEAIAINQHKFSVER